MDVDNYQRLTFSPLQSNFAKETLGDRALDMDSIIYFRNGKAYSKSLAVILILQDMGGLWAIAMMFRVIPAMVRNAIYDIVAKNRYKVFGKYDACRIPSPEEMGRFL